jgi:hypothetical protein
LFDPRGHGDSTPQQSGHDTANYSPSSPSGKSNSGKSNTSNDRVDSRMLSAAGPGGPRSPVGPGGQLLGARNMSSRNLLAVPRQGSFVMQRQSSFVNRAPSSDNQSGQDGVHGSGGEVTLDVNTVVRREQLTPRPPPRLSFSSPAGKGSPRANALLDAAKISAPLDILQPSSPAPPQLMSFPSRRRLSLAGGLSPEGSA